MVINLEITVGISRTIATEKFGVVVVTQNKIERQINGGKRLFKFFFELAIHHRAHPGLIDIIAQPKDKVAPASRADFFNRLPDCIGTIAAAAAVTQQNKAQGVDVAINGLLNAVIYTRRRNAVTA